MVEIYEVGGCVRDSLLGIKSNDVDYVFISSESKIQDAFSEMKSWMEAKKFKLFLITEDCVTIRAKFPDSNLVADFVLARKEIGYEQNSRKPICEAGTLYDDLIRRDFTVNSIARDKNGELIDFFGGQEDLALKILRTPKPPELTFNDDPLRLLRALRFSVKLGFGMAPEIIETIQNFDYQKMLVVSKERIYEELKKMFEADTVSTFEILTEFNALRNYIFSTGIKLTPSLKS